MGEGGDHPLHLPWPSSGRLDSQVPGLWEREIHKVVRLVCPGCSEQETQGTQAKERGSSREGCPESNGCYLAPKRSGNKGSQHWPGGRGRGHREPRPRVHTVSWMQRAVQGPRVKDPGAKEPVGAEKKRTRFLEARE